MELSLKKLLLEYTEKTITSTIDRWKETNPNIDNNTARQVIQRFDQIKSGLSGKLDILALSDDLKTGNNYLNIDKYGWEDIINLLRSLPEKEDKIKKEAIKKFNKETGIPELNLRAYIARFFANKENLKFAAKEGNDQFTSQEVLNFIPKNLQRGDMFLDPRNWRWEPFEQMMDAMYPSQHQGEEGDENYATTDADKVYDYNGIEIYKGDDVNKCISYSPKLDTTGRKKYGWCVSQVGNTNYDYYRFEERTPTFYFVFDRNKPSTPDHIPFDDKWHAFVVQINKTGGYRVTSANNDSDHQAKNWNDIQRIVPADTWGKIKDLEKYFKPIELSPVERGRKFASGKNLSLNEFLELNTDEKVLYIQGKASKNQISYEILNILPQFKIPLEGRSTTLANVAIDSGQKMPYGVLKDYESLAKRYAIFRFRHTDYSETPIPLPYVKYLDEPAKEKYLATFDKNLTFEYIERFFGEEATQKYVDEQVSLLEFIPQGALKYIKDPNKRKLYELYSKLVNNWEFGKETNISDDELAAAPDMPEQSVEPVPMNVNQWLSLPSTDKDKIIELTHKVNGKEEYSTLLYALPYIITQNGKDYILLPKQKQNQSDYGFMDWVLLDENGKIVKDNIKGDTSTIGSDQSLSLGFPNMETDPRRIFPIEDVEFNKPETKSVNEIKVNKPNLSTKCKNLFNKLYELPKVGYDGNLSEEVEEKFISPNNLVWEDEVYLIDLFDQLPQSELIKLYKFLQEYVSPSYDDLNESFKEKYLIERLQFRAGLR